ncbi:MAG: hydantoinase B/oxoprolinase family protein, partial [Anaerolineales bacterium]|nr:hydantoinase B/oxoprolinase family protein [Anaerolineales bacterium]
PARGFMGGKPGAVGDVELSDGRHPHPKTRYQLQPGQRVTLRLPGGGGFHHPFQRDPAAVLDDVRQGYVTLAAARTEYGVAIDPNSWTILTAETAQLRARKSD